MIFEKASVFHLNDANFDHVPIALHTYLDHPQSLRPFRF